MSRPKGRYGIDAPYVPLTLLAAGVGAVALSARTGATLVWAVVAVALFVLAGIYVRTSTSGKFRVWRALLKDVDLRGNERAVDLGCGRGAVTVMMAESLPKGHVDGVDLWRNGDQSGNDEIHTIINLEANGVEHLVTLHSGDLRELPFKDRSVDLVTASLSIHNLKNAEDRKQAVTSAYRILKPGGRLLIADIRAVKEYGAVLTELGAEDVVVRNAGFNGWWSAPFVSTSTLVATKAKGRRPVRRPRTSVPRVVPGQSTGSPGS